MKCKYHCRWDNSQAAIVQSQSESLLRDEVFYVYFSLGMNSC